MANSPGSPGTILNFIPFVSSIEPTFWYKLSEIKLDEDKLKETPRPIQGYFNHNGSCRLYINSSSFSSTSSESFDHFAEGTLLNLNSLESFKSYDKTELLLKRGQIILQAMEDGDIFENLKLLTSFFVLTFADLKKYNFYYWLGFPAPASPTYQLVSNKTLAAVFNESEFASLYEERGKLPPKYQIHFGIQKLANGKCKAFTLDQFLEVLNKDDFDRENNFLVYSDPSNFETYPGWSLRNLLYLINLKCPNCLVKKSLQVICLRNKSPRNQVTPNIVLSVQLSPQGKNKDHSYTGSYYKLSIVFRLASSSIDLNLKLMKWRLMPDLDLDVVKNAKCLLLTMNSLVHYKSLHFNKKNADDDGGEMKFVGWEKNERGKFGPRHVSLKDIFIRKSKGIVLGIPMPGHNGIDAENAATLHELIDSHDVTFLLTDSRESRWLPTVICAALNKIAITSALGFDTYLVMRHGVNDKDNSGGDRSKLGCYFCNDVTAPGNSQTDRTLDQQCTVTRPGVSAIAGALAVELFVSLLQHDKRGALSSDDQCCLGNIPHSIRGFLSQYQTILPSTPSFHQCTACSPKIISEYEHNRSVFLSDVFKNSKHLEDITGLTKLYQDTEQAEADVWDFEPQDED
ncbi:ubiquitin-like modifier-activating enzyme ATG7 [Diaphorina citri]|uniref:Ubiquitin-like modifier-activating enzyme ATG7 n=1 Tax=Diaphorina citri TaxID=121845 RepID=A0A3Q0J7Z7_DIACI|nr:ubiquitin-like modifier-activating enzyme ATG7 [Diaphorina citri]